MTELYFPNCPRCCQEWHKPSLIEGEKFGEWLSCQVCHLIYNIDHNSLSMLIYKDRGLVWHLDDKVCYYGSVRDYFDGKDIKLPFLPYDITFERVKLLLVFS